MIMSTTQAKRSLADAFKKSPNIKSPLRVGKASISGSSQTFGSDSKKSDMKPVDMNETTQNTKNHTNSNPKDNTNDDKVVQTSLFSELAQGTNKATSQAISMDSSSRKCDKMTENEPRQIIPSNNEARNHNAGGEGLHTPVKRVKLSHRSDSDLKSTISSPKYDGFITLSPNEANPIYSPVQDIAYDPTAFSPPSSGQNQSPYSPTTGFQTHQVSYSPRNGSNFGRDGQNGFSRPYLDNIHQSITLDGKPISRPYRPFQSASFCTVMRYRVNQSNHRYFTLPTSLSIKTTWNLALCFPWSNSHTI